jgi:hypothetical protein
VSLTEVTAEVRVSERSNLHPGYGADMRRDMAMNMEIEIAKGATSLAAETAGEGSLEAMERTDNQNQRRRK